MSWGITSEAKAELRDEAQREARRLRIDAKKRQVRLRRSDRNALHTDLRRRIFGL